jgi:hypothetical protein
MLGLTGSAVTATSGWAGQFHSFQFHWCGACGALVQEGGGGELDPVSVHVPGVTRVLRRLGAAAARGASDA